MKIQNFFMKFILLFALVSGITAQLVCQDVSSPSEDNQSCECENDMYYDAYEGKCADICSYYGDSLCGHSANAVCINSDVQEPSNYTCDCPPGYDMTIDPNVGLGFVCFPGDPCDNNTSECLELDEVCLDLGGGSYDCVCPDYYYRSEDGECVELDMCNLQDGGNICQHICTNGDFPGEYNCSCNTGYVLQRNGYSCVLDEDYEECDADQNIAGSSCAILTVNGTVVREPLPGYEENEDGEFNDINECADETVYQCVQYSVCENLNGSYTCNCIDDYQWYGNIECKKRTCQSGYALYNHECQEFCNTELGPQCPYDAVCLVDDNNVPFCDCQLFCQMKGMKNKTYSLYAYELHFTTGYNVYYQPMHPTDVFQITKSFGSIFGRDNVQILSFSGSYVQMAIGLYTPLSKVEDLSEMVSNICYPYGVSSGEELCVLPGNIIATKNYFASFDIYPCQYFSNLCTKGNAECVDAFTDKSISPGNYVCNCREGFEQVGALEEVYCTDIDECYMKNSNCTDDSVCVNTPGSFNCVPTYNNTVYTLYLTKKLKEAQNDLSDQEHTTKVVGGVLGAFFGLAFVVLAFALFYIYKMKMKTKQTV